MDLRTDSAGQQYIDVDTVRLTYVPREMRTEKKDWAGRPVIRIQAYREGTSGPLHQGAEFPVDSREEVLSFVEAFCQLCRLK
jgi:hypothetical protein